MPTTPPPAEQNLTPEVYLNHFSPAEAHEEEIRRDITMVLVGVVLWDVFTYIPSDIRIIRKSPFRSTILSFIISRSVPVVQKLVYLSLLTFECTRTDVHKSNHSPSSGLLPRYIVAYNRSSGFIADNILVLPFPSTSSGDIQHRKMGPTMFYRLLGTGYFKSAKLKPWVATCD
ncbi:hypothetical protein Agabi119p4_11731 [Agaricus bisporus var. burnettii]|uniref:Uncharacterized protein n=1 Tax=Agaricus bisporus var. burnettii TaxID=192524 RepID=A0A8H7C0A3_AGABI|nr:hypothetical protein Agabi119p4_11731 [Agaricus bisporus var. burnettii]